MNKVRLTLIILALVAVTLVFPLSIVAAEKVFKIGLCLSFSGSTGSWGKIFSQGDQLQAKTRTFLARA